MRQVQGPRLGGDEVVLWDGDQLRPTALVDGRVGVREKAEDLVADLETTNVPTDLLDSAGEVAPECDRELVLDHLLDHAAGDGDVRAVYRRGEYAHEHLTVARVGLRQVIA